MIFRLIIFFNIDVIYVEISIMVHSDQESIIIHLDKMSIMFPLHQNINNNPFRSRFQL